MELCWGKKVDAAFIDAVFDLCRNLNWTSQHANWLMACMAFESGRTFSPSVRNAAGSGATGLIQFMPATAKDLGTSTTALSVMTAVEQLHYVELYFKPYASRIASLSDMYMAILLPKYVGKPEESVLFSSGIAYRQNSGLDANDDGKVTKAEATARVSATYQLGMTERYCYQY